MPGVPWYTTVESKITRKSELNVHAAYMEWIVVS